MSRAIRGSSIASLTDTHCKADASSRRVSVAALRRCANSTGAAIVSWLLAFLIYVHHPLSHEAALQLLCFEAAASGAPRGACEWLRRCTADR